MAKWEEYGTTDWEVIADQVFDDMINNLENQFEDSGIQDNEKAMKWAMRKMIKKIKYYKKHYIASWISIVYCNIIRKIKGID